MKQLTIIAAIFLGLPFASTAQVHKHSLGLRMNSHFPYYRPSLSYQFGLNNKNRLDFNITTRGANTDAFSFRTIDASIYYEHVMNIKGGLNWFVGAGVRYQYFKSNSPTQSSLYQNLAIGPTIGLEYDFNHKNVPLLLSLDYRPSVGYGFGSHGTNFQLRQNLGLSLHYTFKDKKKGMIKDL
ncbi:MAG: hypothetical protein GQ574_11590 [Crocinitomix sp.]|nr:hypothetical protein [Crocinitomix sp.]